MTNNFSLNIIHNGITIESQSTMSYPIAINEVSSTDTSITLNINSPIQQYFIFKFYDSNIDPLTNDTTWKSFGTTEELGGNLTVDPELENVQWLERFVIFSNISVTVIYIFKCC